MATYTASNVTQTWTYWNDTSITGVSITADPVWRYWATNDGGTATTAASTWTHWTTDSTSGTDVIKASDQYRVWAEHVEVKKLSRAEKKAERKRLEAVEVQRRHHQAEAERVMKAADEKRKLASQRAEKLLLSHLSETQEKAWREERAFFVTSQSGKLFKIKEGRAHNIFELDAGGVPIREYCVHVAEDVPNADNVLAQKLALEHGEAAMLQLANSWPMVNGRR